METIMAGKFTVNKTSNSGSYQKSDQAKSTLENVVDFSYPSTSLLKSSLVKDTSVAPPKNPYSFIFGIMPMTENNGIKKFNPAGAINMKLNPVNFSAIATVLRYAAGLNADVVAMVFPYKIYTESKRADFIFNVIETKDKTTSANVAINMFHNDKRCGLIIPVHHLDGIIKGLDKQYDTYLNLTFKTGGIVAAEDDVEDDSSSDQSTSQTVENTEAPQLVQQAETPKAPAGFQVEIPWQP